MKRSLVAMLVALGFLLSALPVRAQAPPTAIPGKKYRIYMVTFRGLTDVERGFKDYLAAQGVEAEYIMRDINKDEHNIPPLVAEIKRIKPDLVYTYGTPVTLGIVGPINKPDPKKYVDTAQIPVIFTMVATPRRANIVKSFDDPGRDVTGVFNVVPTKQQIAAIASYRPFKKLALLYAGNAKNSQVIADDIKAIGQEEGFEVIARTFNTSANGEPVIDGVDKIVHDMKAAGAQWLYLPPDSFLGDALYKVIPAADKERLPTFGSTEQMMQGGALAGIICKYYSLGQLTAYKAQQILVGGRPAHSVPVETLKRFSFQVTLPLAREFDMFPPIELFNYAEILTKIGVAPKPKAAKKG